MPRIGRLDIFWSVNKLARAITKWTRACYKRLARVVHSSHLWIQNTAVMWEIQHNNADWDCFKTLILQEMYKDSKSSSGRLLCISRSHTFLPVNWICKKQTSDSHSSIEAEIISLDASFTHGWNTSSWSLGFGWWSDKKSKDQARGDSSGNTTSNKHTKNQTKVAIYHDDLQLSNVDYDSSNEKSSRPHFEHNEAVIKMIIKGRSPTMRHVSRIHRVALDLLVWQN